MSELQTKDIVVCDLDGTLALDDHRNHHLQKSPRDWDTYFSLCEHDEVNHPVAELIRILHNAGKQIYILSGRRGDYKAHTTRWLEYHQIPYTQLELRAVGDRTDDNLLKLQWVESMGISTRIWLVLEDRNRVVASWRKAGYTTLQVRPGDF